MTAKFMKYCIILRQPATEDSIVRPHPNAHSQAV
jgi:hypothetical protein